MQRYKKKEKNQVQEVIFMLESLLFLRPKQIMGKEGTEAEDVADQ